MAFPPLDSVTNQYQLYVPYEPYSPAELSAMAYHGLLRDQFGPYYVDTELPDTTAQRAKAVKMAGEQLVTGEWTARMLTAAWIHLGGQAPEMLEAGTATYQRARLRSRIIPTALRHLDYQHSPDVADEDVLMVGGVMVTSIDLTVKELLDCGGTRRHIDKAGGLAQLTGQEHLLHRIEAHSYAEDFEIAG